MQVEQQEDVTEDVADAKRARQTLLNIVEAFRRQEAYKKKMNLMYVLCWLQHSECATCLPTRVTTRMWCMIQANLGSRTHVAQVVSISVCLYHRPVNCFIPDAYQAVDASG